MIPIQKHFEEGWWLKLSPFLTSEVFKKIGRRLDYEQNVLGQSITPLFNNTFRAFRECSYNKLKVVILGQDPYPEKGIADGIAFSARNHLLNPPPSLKHIVNAIEKEVYGGFAIGYNEQYAYPDLTRWANQGILLINTALSTVVGKTNHHADLWTPFTSYLFRMLAANNTGLIYILLGAKAKAWKLAIDSKRNHVLTASHPASICYSGAMEWDSEGVFSKTNELLEQMNGPEAKILW